MSYTAGSPPQLPASIAACEQSRNGGATAPASEWPAVHKSAIVDSSQGERPCEQLVPTTSPVASNCCSTQHAGTGVGAHVKNVGSDVGRAVGAGVGTGVGKIVGAGVQYVGAPVVGAAVSSSRRAPSRRPLDRRAFGPLRGGRCPTTTALRNKHRQAIIMNDGSPLLHDLG